MNRILLGIVIGVFILGICCSNKLLKDKIVNDNTLTNILTLKYVPAGIFQRDENTANTSSVSAFYMSEKEITREQFEKVMGYDPSDTQYSLGKQDPVQMVNWYHALIFCNKLSMLEGLTPVYTINGSTDPAQWESVPLMKEDFHLPTNNTATWDAVTVNWNANGYRLPTEMEWMWAAMGADKDNPGKVNATGYNKKFAGSNGNNNIGDYAWYDKNSNNTTHPVGTKQPNELGLYDMSGNVWEWCWDWWTKNYPSGSTTNYKGAASGDDRVERGGSGDSYAWDSYANCSIFVSRGKYYPCVLGFFAGFRVVRSN